LSIRNFEKLCLPFWETLMSSRPTSYGFDACALSVNLKKNCSYMSYNIACMILALVPLVF
jgi:hypothetical protein